VPDNRIDCILIYWRVNSKISTKPDNGQFNSHLFYLSIYSYPPAIYPPIVIGNKTEISSYGRVYADDIGSTTFQHEIGHGFVGSNDFHSGGAGGGIGTYMQDYSGYSILSSGNRYHRGYNAWDRYRLGWKNPHNMYEISARNEIGQEVNADLDYMQQTGNSVTYILRDFATTGDAVRIKLPYIRTLNPSAKEQWLWIENHQLLQGKVEYEEQKHGANSQMYKIPRGIYLNLQVGNEDFSSFSSHTNYIAPINKFGRFDFTNYTQSTLAGGKPVIIGETGNAYANPFTGVGFASFHPSDRDNNDVINNNEEYSIGKTKYNGIEINANYFASPEHTCIGSVYDAYYQGDKISISTNPSINTSYTYRCSYRGTNNNTPETIPALDDNRKIYLNGLSIQVVEQRVNGDIKISINWKDYQISNDVRWCGDIVLNETIDLQSNKTLLLDYGLTPTRPVNPVIFNGKKIFADPTIFTCKQGSLFKANSTSTVRLKNNSTLIAESGSKIELLDDVKLVVESGSTLILKSNSSLKIVGRGRIIIESGGYLCVESGANINLQDVLSAILLRDGAILGANPALFNNANCISNAANIQTTGNGAIHKQDTDVYVQNETISANRFVAGKNIFVGNHVTNTKPYGDVIINNNATVILDANSEVFLEAGVEVQLGSELEIR